MTQSCKRLLYVAALFVSGISAWSSDFQLDGALDEIDSALGDFNLINQYFPGQKEEAEIAQSFQRAVKEAEQKQPTIYQEGQIGDSKFIKKVTDTLDGRIIDEQIDNLYQDQSLRVVSYEAPDGSKKSREKHRIITSSKSPYDPYTLSFESAQKPDFFNRVMNKVSPHISEDKPNLSIQRRIYGDDPGQKEWHSASLNEQDYGPVESGFHQIGAGSQGDYSDEPLLGNIWSTLDQPARQNNNS